MSAALVEFADCAEFPRWPRDSPGRDGGGGGERTPLLSGPVDAGLDPGPVDPPGEWTREPRADPEWTPDSRDSSRHPDLATVDWLSDVILERTRLRSLRSHSFTRSLRHSRIHRLLDSAQAWVAVTLIGVVVGFIAAAIDLSSDYLSNLKSGYCSTSLLNNQKLCCPGQSAEEDSCPAWIPWSTAAHISTPFASYFNHAAYCLFGILFAVISSLLVITLSKRENSKRGFHAAGSGIPQVKIILGGFVMRGFLGFKTLVAKILGLTLSVASGLTLGKEGPLVHIACAIGNVVSRVFPKYANNEAKKRELLSAACASGVSVAFGSPIGGVLFSLEEVSQFFPSKTMWRSFYCAMVAAVTLKILDPFGKGKIVKFQTTYDREWHAFELAPFLIIGVFGGLFGAIYIRLHAQWSALRTRLFWQHPVLETTCVAALTLLLGYLSIWTRISNSELVTQLLRECPKNLEPVDALCDLSKYKSNLIWLFVTMVFKMGFMVITFGMAVPAGIFIPSMVVGACFGRMVGIATWVLQTSYPDLPFFHSCLGFSDECIVPGVYALLGAAACLAGVTRLTVSLAVVLFELTGDLDHILPIMVAIMVAKWTGDAFGRDGIYDCLIAVNGAPYLDHKKEYLNAQGTALDIMEQIPLISCDSQYSIDTLDRLDTKFDSGCAVVDSGTKYVGYISTQSINHAIISNRDNGHFLFVFRNKFFAHARFRASPTQLATAILIPPFRSSTMPYSTSYESIHTHFNSSPTPSTPPSPKPTTRDLNHSSTRSTSSSSTPHTLSDSHHNPINDLSPHIITTHLTVSPHTSIDALLQIFVKLGCKLLVVVDEGRFLGVVYRKRICGYLKENGVDH